MATKKNFIKKKEDFICKNCGFIVVGSGYTNHCPNCFYSLHVDKDIPGDRLSTCRGTMEPVGVELKHGKYVILHKCTKCGKTTRNKVSENDNFEEMLKIV